MSDAGAQPPPLDPLVVGEVNKAYYSTVLMAPERARTRALNASTIAGTAAGALVAAGAIGDVERLPWWIALCGYVTVLLWLAAATAYLAAVAGPARAAGAGPAVNEGADAAAVSAQRKIAATEQRLRLIQRRAGVAHRLAVAAVVATALIIGLTAVAARGDAREQATVVLSADGARELGRVCGTVRGTVRARVDPQSLGGDVLRLELGERVCAGRDEVSLRSELVTVVAFDE